MRICIVCDVAIVLASVLGFYEPVHCSDESDLNNGDKVEVNLLEKSVLYCYL